MLLKQLSEAMGPSGFEDEIRNVIRDEVTPLVADIRTDVLGNLIVSNGSEHRGPRVMLDAHMDEVGLMIVQVCEGGRESGLLKFRALGGIDPRVLVSKPVFVGNNRIPGVIGAKPIHLQERSERRKPLAMDQLYIDIGAKDAKDAKAVVKPGDVAIFATQFGTLGERAVKGKSFDDRIGCALLIEALRESYDLPVVGAFTVQEEIGLRGAQAAAYAIEPDIAIALEGTVCFDVVGAKSHGQGTIMGAGPALTVQDAQTVADRRFLDFMVSVAEKHGIPYQLRRVKGGSNDYGAIHKVRSGIIGGAISVPVRYIHAPTQVASLDDFDNSLSLLKAVLRELEQGGYTA
ncbi:M42 family metallopeptidase [Alicyclobacillus fastidiosus]|uniref:M42 family metallopeptidase n=1 Tax=Alicyclobacillus fastidiosus TaxID=392011 RepID=A0ABV5AAT9_9BACL|nr:M42 family metallopeptidase [Alicyclobacillus fastidiosus]WEH11845.1 M42 family metallopeptidase [Alicyclobacillus fastidiosus]